MAQTAPSAWGNSETQLFFDLSPEKILSTVERLGVRCTGRCIPLNSMENRVFEIELEESAAEARPRTLVAKFYRPGRWSSEQILEEHRFLLDLIEQDIPVVGPLPFKSGNTLEKVDGAEIFCAVFPKQRGRHPDELDTDKLLRLGRLLARVHNIGASREAPNRLRLDPKTYGLGNLNSLLETSAIPEELSRRYTNVVREICKRSAPLFERAKFQRIHGDCHFGNILWGDEGPFLVDFDDMVQGPPVQDLWLLVPGRDSEARNQLDVFLSGYEEMREFDHSSLKLIEPLRALRFVHFSAWIEKRWSDPAFQRNYPLFGSGKYWNDQLVDLEEQLEIISRYS